MYATLRMPPSRSEISRMAAAVSTDTRGEMAPWVKVRTWGGRVLCICVWGGRERRMAAAVSSDTRGEMAPWVNVQTCRKKQCQTFEYGKMRANV